jgi:hypothetical protein
VYAQNAGYAVQCISWGLGLHPLYGRFCVTPKESLRDDGTDAAFGVRPAPGPALLYECSGLFEIERNNEITNYTKNVPSQVHLERNRY